MDHKLSNKVWTVEYSDNEEFDINGIFTDEDRADSVCDELNNTPEKYRKSGHYNVQEYELNKVY
jgi:hypothetical protein